MHRTKKEHPLLRNIRASNKPVTQIFVIGFIGITFVLLSLVLNGCSTMGDKRALTKNEVADLQVEVALSALSAGDTVTAYHRLNEAEETAPKYWKIPFTRSFVHLKRKDIKSAIEESKRAVALDPENPAANNNLGKLLIDVGQFTEAEGVLVKSAQSLMNQEPQQANTNLGILYIKQGKISQAKEFLSTAIEQAPKSACAAFYYRGQIYMKEKQIDHAIRFFEKSTKNACGQFKEPHLAIGIALSEAKRFDQARAKFLEVSQLFPDTPIAEEALERLKFLP